jgi:hypothetical protein
MRGTMMAVAVVAACAALGSCGGDDRGDGTTGGTFGPSCAAVCEAIKKCDPEDAEDCVEECPQMREAFQSSVWNSYANCVQNEECDGQGDCMENAIQSAPASNMDGFVDEVCEWMAGCAGGFATMTREECEKFMTEGDDPGEGSPMDFLRAIKAEILDCLADCITDAECTESDFEKVAMECGEQCGLPIGSTSSESTSYESTSDAPPPFDASSDR